MISPGRACARCLGAVVALALALTVMVPTSAGAASGAGFPPLVRDPTGSVDPFIGTSGGGNEFPGASLPFGMMQWGPVETTGNQDTTVGDSAEYTYGTSKVRGFSLTHLSGGGCPQEAGDVPIMPYAGAVRSSPSADVTDAVYSSTFSHANEVAQPGYYSVRLQSGVDVALSVTKRTGSGTFTFPRDEPAAVLFRTSNSDAGSGDAYTAVDPSTRTVSGWVTSGGACGNGNDVSDRRVYYRLFFVAQFDRSFAAYGGWDDGALHPGARTASGGEGMNEEAGHGSGAYVTFDASRHPEVGMRVGISYVSARNALANLHAEDPAGTTLRTIRARAHAAWRQELDRIRIGGGTTPQRTVFYTALYHALLEPNLVSDVNGQYEGADSGDGRPGPVETIGRHQAAQYGSFSGWDQYRGQVQLVTLLNPQVGSDLAQSLLNFADQNGGVWDRWLDRNGSISTEEGDPSPTAVAGILAFGGHQFDVKDAYRSLLTAATRPTAADGSGEGCPVVCAGQRPELRQYLDLHYVPAAACRCWGSVGETLEDANADFSVAELARAVGDRTTYRAFLARAGYWRNVFDPAATGSGFAGYMQQRNADGSWVPGFDDASWAGFAEGSSAEYTYMVFPDVAGLVRLLGGDAATVQRLDAFFADDGTPTATGAEPTLYDPTNEPDLQVPWMYDYVGAPSRTQATLRRVVNVDWNDSTAGVPGGDDLGTMSAWNVWASLGMYPYVPSQANLVLSSPVFPRAVIHRANGVTVTIDAPGDNAGTTYVQRLAVNGRPSDQPWVPASLVTAGGVLRYTLSDQPSTTWGTDQADAPPSLSTPPGLTVSTASRGRSPSAPARTAVVVRAGDLMSGLASAPVCRLDGKAPLALHRTGPAWTATVTSPGAHRVSCAVTDNEGNRARVTAAVEVR